MPFKRVDTAKEQRELDELLKRPEAKNAYDEFTREYEFRQKLAAARKTKKMTQQEIQNITGLPQQSISRIEKGTTQKQSPTLRTLLKYIDAIGYELTIQQTQKKN
jgi:DNA-binding XRE family transcriptional regulator